MSQFAKNYPRLIMALLLNAEYLQAAEAVDSPVEELLIMPFDKLMGMNISTSVGRKPQNVQDSAAAVFVVSAEDIRRSGATSIPEALRMVPGLQVARINASQWAVSARGFNERTSNKLLVLMDGRTLYMPTYSGTLWETLDMPLDNIERIEVIRGPGATLWGANAVNGIINIISKSAQKNQNTRLSLNSGNEQTIGFGRYGFQWGSNNFGRVHFQGRRHYGYDSPTGGNNADDWDSRNGGFQLEMQESDADAFMVQGNFLQGRFNQQGQRPQLTAPYVQNLQSNQDSTLVNLLSRWHKVVSDKSDFSLQAYYDYQQHQFYLPVNFHQLDVDFQHHLKFEHSPHELLWGLGYRYVQDHAFNNAYYQVNPASRAYQLFSGFIQSELTLLPETLKFIVGSKLEHNDFSGFEYQPNARLLWTPDHHQTLWAAVSRAIKPPTRTKHDLNVWFATVPASADTGYLPVKIEGYPSIRSDKIKAEEVFAYELGYRLQWSPAVIDLTGFYNRYDSVTEIVGTKPKLRGGGAAPYLLLPTELINGVSGYSYGFELAATWQINTAFKLNLSYSYIDAYFQKHNHQRQSGFSDSSPQHQINLRPSFDLADNLALDLWFRYVDRLEEVNGRSVDSYTSLDARLAYRPVKNLELALAGQNLIEPHTELNANLAEGGGVEALLPRHVYLKATLDF